MTRSHSSARVIATRLAGMAHAYLAGQVTEEQLVKRLRRLALDLEGHQVLKPAPKAVGDTGLAERVFAHWQRRMMKPKAKLTAGRRSVIQARARDGYTERQMRTAIDACAASEFHMGDNDRKQAYNDLTLIFRTGEKLEAFVEMAGGQDPQQGEEPEIRRLQREAADAMNRGDMDAYNRANAQLSAARTAASG